MPRQIKALYLLPLPISDRIDDLPPSTLEALQRCTAFICERVRTFRRWVKFLDHPLAIDDMALFEMDKRNPHMGLSDLQEAASQHEYVGIVSEAGCPGIADPGFRYTEWAQKNGITVRSFTGPNSLLLALMNSGFSGQNFAFHGYLSAKKPQLAKDLQMLESISRKHNQAQIFIEAPYRNHQILDVATSALAPETLLHVSVDLHSDEEWNATKSLNSWAKDQLPNLHKRPAVFVLKAGKS